MQLVKQGFRISLLLTISVCLSTSGLLLSKFITPTRLFRVLPLQALRIFRPWKKPINMITEPPSSLVYGSDDVLFAHIEQMQMPKRSGNFGSLLDAGTGIHSLRWMASIALRTNSRFDSPKAKVSLPVTMSTYTAVTADLTMQTNVLEEARRLGIDKYGQIIIGNWDDSTGSTPLCENETFDTILADYLIGAIDGFSPYFQDLIFPRLSSHLKPGGRLYVVGLNPIPDKAEDDGNIICKVAKLRDACILLAGHRCYREYPVEWIERHLKLAGLKVVDIAKFPILYSQSTIVRQLNVARSKLPLFPSKALADEMENQIAALEKESEILTSKSIDGRIKLGFDYVITAEK